LQSPSLLKQTIYKSNTQMCHFKTEACTLTFELQAPPGVDMTTKML